MFDHFIMVCGITLDKVLVQANSSDSFQRVQSGVACNILMSLCKKKLPMFLWQKGKVVLKGGDI